MFISMSMFVSMSVSISMFKCDFAMLISQDEFNYMNVDMETINMDINTDTEGQSIR
jgi:hypothetical protein